MHQKLVIILLFCNNYNYNEESKLIQITLQITNRLQINNKI